MGFSTNIKKFGLDYAYPLTVSKEARLMLEVYGDLGLPLVGREKYAMIKYVNDEVTAVNHSLKDYETIYSLEEPNSLIDYIGGKIATKVNAPIWSRNGYIFNTTNYIDSNYNPNIHAINYTLNNFSIGSFIKKVEYVSGFPALFGSVLRIEFSHELSNNRSIYYMNSTGVLIVNGVVFDDNTYYSGTRTLVNKYELLKNGLPFLSSFVASSNVPTSSIKIGVNGRGVLSGFFNGTILNFGLGGVINSEIDHYNNLRNLLINLGVTLW